MALSAFQTKRAGEDQFRVAPSGFVPPDGDHALVLGSDTAGYARRFAVGDKLDVFQANTPAAADKVVRFLSRVRGPSHVPALSGGEPFGLANGQTLILALNYGANQVVTFNTGDFVSIAAATAAEVAAVINDQITGGVAGITGDGQVAIYSARRGRRSRVQVVGGTANGALVFRELAWFARFLVGGAVLHEVELWPGLTRDLSDWVGNLAGYSAPVDVRFRLEVVAKT